MVSHSGSSSGANIQLKIAPATGIMNFHKLSSEIFTPGRCISINQIEKATAAMKLSHSNTTQYSTGKKSGGLPSIGKDTRYRTTPPRNREEELRTNGLSPLLLSDINTFPVARAIFAIRIIRTPRSSIREPSLKACLPALIKITPAMPKTIVIIFFLESMSFLSSSDEITAVTKGWEPTTTAPSAPGTKLSPW